MSSHLTGVKSTSESADATADRLYQSGISAYKNGEIARAHLLLQQSAYLNPKNKAVWLALYQVTNDDADRITCLENAIRLKAKNPRIAERLEQLQRRQRIINGISDPTEPPMKSSILNYRLLGGVLVLLAVIGLLLHFQIIP